MLSGGSCVNAQRPRDYDPQPIRGLLPVRSFDLKERSPATTMIAARYLKLQPVVMYPTSAIKCPFIWERSSALT